MGKTVLLTGATDGIGFETAKILMAKGHNLLLHGRNSQKADQVNNNLFAIKSNAQVTTYIADFAILSQVRDMAKQILNGHENIDVIINNAGIFTSKDGLSPEGLDIRFVVNTIAPYLLTRLLLPCLNENARIINLSSAAQAPIDFKALANGGELDAHSAYAQSKLALIMWGMELAEEFEHNAQNNLVVSVNPKSFLGSKMVKEAYGQQGFDLRIGADILYHAAFSEEFKKANGKYFDNDIGRFTTPHPFALLKENRARLIQIMDAFLQLA